MIICKQVRVPVLTMKKAILNSIVLLIVVLTICSCCRSPLDRDIKNALVLAGNNRVEIEKVLDYFKNDSLKYEATSTLIINMATRLGVAYQSDDYETFTSLVYDSLENLGTSSITSDIPFINKLLRKKSFEEIWDHYAVKLGDPVNFQFGYKVDLQNIRADFLIENIEYAFRAWQLPWSRNYSFDEFCQYILPYRYSNESLSPWRKIYWDKLGYVVDSLGNEPDPIKAAIYINEQLKTYYWGSDKLKNMSNRVKPADLLRGLLAGNCEDQVGLGYAVMRAFGIATSEIIIPNWGNRVLQGHSFSAILDPVNQKWVDFHAGDINPLDNTTTLMPKAFLRDNLNPGAEDNLLSYYENFSDLTSQFTKAVDVEVELDSAVEYPPYAYLCVFNSKDWQPIMWGNIKDNKVRFTEMGVSKVYLPAIFQNDQITPIGAPISIDATGEARALKPDVSNFISASLRRKYTLQDSILDSRCNDLVGGRFQVANRSDFSDARTIYTVPEFSSYIPIEQEIYQTLGRYVRFIFPKVERIIKDGPAQLSFLTSSGDHYVPLRGKYMSSEPIAVKNMEAIFDDNLLSFVSLLKSDLSLPLDFWNYIPFTGHIDSLWVGMDLGKAESINRISFCPRNDKNNIYPGLIYELFYWDNDWISLGQRKAISHQLEYEHIPRNALLLLKCYSEGVEERVFTLGDKRNQVWW